MATGVDPKNDYVFKRVCGDEDNALVLVAVLNAVLRFPTGKMIRGVTLLNPFVAQDYAEGKVPILDVRARDDPGRQFILEMQLLLQPAFATRLLYYWAGGHAEQLLKGERYELLQPTYSICFLNETMFADAVYHHCFRVSDDEHGVLLGKDLEMHVIELSKFTVAVEEVRTPLERWCYFFKHGASLELATLPATLEDPMIRKALEVLMKVSQSELERQRFLERQRAERDAASLAATARIALEDLRAAQEALRATQANAKTAKEEARLAFDEGQQKGIEKGEVIGRIRLLEQLLKVPETARDELKQLSEEDLAKREESLKQQLSGQKEANGTPPDGRT